ncbi:MAG TPA: copper homeostasis membrane protein CopD [Stellaceae bacterium]|nr:copper homeostasis membrane protein CopD [Stellaceae bacterium]
MQGILIAARALHFAATIVLAGIFGFVCLVAVPAFRRCDVGIASAGRLRRRLGALAGASLLVALISGAAWLVAVAADMSGKPLGLALSQGVVGVVLTSTHFGIDWLLRLGLAVLIGLCLLVPQRRLRIFSAVLWAGFALALVLLASLAWAGHGAATPGSPGDLHLAADVLHLLGAGLWLGTLPPLALLLAEARRAGDAGWAAAARMAMRRYSTLAFASVSVLLAGGVVNTWFLAGTVPALVGTAYGRLLLGKIALFIAMLLIAAVNLLRLGPRLAASAHSALSRTTAQLRRNALLEAAIGFGVLAIVGILGTLPPGLHTEPGWPFPFRVDLAALAIEAKFLLAFLAALFCLCAVAAVAAAAAGCYRRSAASVAGLVLCLAIAWVPLRPVVTPAYPTSFYAPAEPYSAAAVAAGAAVYAENCAICHGAGGHGDGPAAAGLPIRPADLTEPHLFAHSPGDLFWWISHGRANGVMPGFARVLTPRRRWDVIHFIRARAAGVLAQRIGRGVTTDAAPQLPDFAFETDGAQQTLRQRLARGPVLLVLFAPPAPTGRLRQLAAATPRLKAAGLAVIAVGLGPSSRDSRDGEASLPLVVGASSEAKSALALFRSPDDGGETELMLDRNADIRARWTRGTSSGLAAPATLVADALEVARIPAAAPSHAGHVH